jgi:nucleotide-binding universal stress UspA family protein
MFGNATIGLKEGLAHGPLLELAKKATQPGAKLHLVTLVRAGTYKDEPERLKRAERDLEKHASALRSDGYEVTHEVQLIALAAALELVRITSEQGSDLVIIGLAKRSRVGKALMGSDAQRVLMAAPAPVLVMQLQD